MGPKCFVGPRGSWATCLTSSHLFPLALPHPECQPLDHASLTLPALSPKEAPLASIWEDLPAAWATPSPFLWSPTPFLPLLQHWSRGYMSCIRVYLNACNGCLWRVGLCVAFISFLIFSVLQCISPTIIFINGKKNCWCLKRIVVILCPSLPVSYGIVKARTRYLQSLKPIITCSLYIRWVNEWMRIELATKTWIQASVHHLRS